MDKIISVENTLATNIPLLFGYKHALIYLQKKKSQHLNATITILIF